MLEVSEWDLNSLIFRRSTGVYMGSQAGETLLKLFQLTHLEIVVEFVFLINDGTVGNGVMRYSEVWFLDAL